MDRYSSVMILSSWYGIEKIPITSTERTIKFPTSNSHCISHILTGKTIKLILIKQIIV